jgi:hypothetical protein
LKGASVREGPQSSGFNSLMWIYPFSQVCAKQGRSWTLRTDVQV